MEISKARSTRHMRNCLRLFESIEGLEFIIFDVETTGVKKNIDFIIELAAVKCKIINKVAVQIDEIDIFLKPPFMMERKIIDIHGITNEFLEDKPSEKDEMIKIKHFFGNYPILVGHNVSFDISMMEEMYKRCGEKFQYEVALDTLEMSRDIVPQGDTENYTLSAVTKLYNLDDGIKFHRGIDDVKAVLRILNLFHYEYKKKITNITLQNKEKVYINYMYFWEGFNKKQKGLYLNTNLGKIYLSTFQKCWCSSEVVLDKVDIDNMEAEVIKKTGLGFEELSKITKSKWEKLKEIIYKKG